MKRILVTLCLALMVSLLPASAACSATGPVRPGAALGTLPGSEKRLDVPYVPTPKRVVDKMLDMAKVGPADTVYDLGCGDGRLVITAAREKGAKGVGVDLNPERIRESKENAAKARVEDRVTFLRQDLFETDIREASVLTMYLLREVNLRLRPRILRELKPGSRVVSHDFDMDDWRPDEEAKVDSSRIYSWVVPANASGKWELRVHTGEERSSRYSLTIEQSFQKVDGSAFRATSLTVLKDAKLKGDALEFTIEEQTIDGNRALLRFEGRIDGDSIQGTMIPLGKRGGERVTFSAERNPETARPIDTPPDSRHGVRWTYGKDQANPGGARLTG